MPKTTSKSVRNAIGRPEKGVRMIRTPSRMSALVRDMGEVYPMRSHEQLLMAYDHSRSDYNDEFSSQGVRVSLEMSLNLRDRPGYHFFMYLREFARDDHL